MTFMTTLVGIPIIALALQNGTSSNFNPAIEFNHLTTDHGLTNSTVETIYQDKKGFIWIGTRDGLNRYDGKDMIPFKTNPNQPKSLSDNFITSIAEDDKGTLWIGTINGLNAYSYQHDTFYQIKNLHEPTNLKENYITKIKFDPSNGLWIATKGGTLIHKKKNATTLYKLNRIYSNIQIYDILSKSTNEILIATNKGVFLLSIQQQKVSPIFPIISVQCLSMDTKKNIFIGTSNQGVWILNKDFFLIKILKKAPNERDGLLSNQIKSIACDKKGSIWIGSINGSLTQYHLQNNSLIHYQNNVEIQSSLSQRTISAILEDKQGNLWIGTHRGGINIYFPTLKKFKLFQKNKERNSLSYNDVRAFCEDSEGQVWIGTDGGGITLMGKSQTSFRHFLSNPTNPRSLGSNEILAITQDRHGNIWVGTWGAGLHLFNKKTSDFTRIPSVDPQQRKLDLQCIQQIYEDSQGNLWIGSYYSGLYLFDPEEKTFTRIEKGTNNTHIKGNNILSIKEDNRKNLWIGTDDGGLNCYNLETKKVKHYFHEEKNRSDFQFIHPDKKNRLWLGQTGLYLYNQRVDRFELFHDALGIKTLFVKSIEEDTKGNLWISTSDGLFKLNPDTKVGRKYTPSDGLQGKEFEPNSSVTKKNGEMYFGGTHGFNSFFPNQVKDNPLIPSIHITGFTVHQGKDSSSENFMNTNLLHSQKEIQLDHTQSTFNLKFVALNLIGSENNQYAYRLKNWDKNWIFSKNINSASYTNVRPGSYVFQVIASNNDGVWNQEGLSIRLDIAPPIWERWWFRIMALILFLYVTFRLISYQNHLKYLKLEKIKSEKIHQEKLNFLKTISNELKIPISLIIGSIEILKKDENYKLLPPQFDLITKNTVRISKLINEILDFKKSEIGEIKLNIMNGNIHSFLNEIYQEFRDIALEKNIQFDLIYNSKQNEAWFDRQILEKIFINLVSNSFQYIGKGNRIELEVHDSLDQCRGTINYMEIRTDLPKANTMIYLIVRDNGQGIAEKSLLTILNQHTTSRALPLEFGVGLTLVKSLTVLHKGFFHIHSQTNQGTEILIGLPIQKIDYSPKEIWTRSKKLSSGLDSLQTLDQFNLIRQDVVQTQISKHTKRNFSILLLEETQQSKTTLTSNLSYEYQIIESRSVEEAMDLVKNVIPDLIILHADFHFHEFCYQLSTSPPLNSIPKVLIQKNYGSKLDLNAAHSTIKSQDIFPFQSKRLIERIEILASNKERLIKTEDSHETKNNRLFFYKLIEIIELNMNNPEMNIDYICTQIGMSRTNLYNRLKQVSGQSIGDFIRIVRLNKAAQLLIEDKLPIIEVMYTVGIQTQSYFSKAFKLEFGKSPLQYSKETIPPFSNPH